MSISLFLPLLYLLFGIILGRFPTKIIKNRLSSILSKWIIPLVIVYNIATYQEGMLYIMLGMILMMGIIVLIGKYFKIDAIETLCLCYLNIGWLGLPIVATLFGNEAAQVLISAYIGSSLFGNSVGVGLLINDNDFIGRLKKTIISPPVIALIIGFLCLPFKTFILQNLDIVYSVLKIIMGLFGMVILGIWLAETKLNWRDFVKAVIPFTVKVSLFFGLTYLLIQLAMYFNLNLIRNNQETLYLIALLPPAANIIVLETFYLKTGRSAPIIAYGTIFSLIAISIYVSFVLYF